LHGGGRRCSRLSLLTEAYVFLTCATKTTGALNTKPNNQNPKPETRNPKP